MEEKGLIVRERGKKDERVVTISITEAGKNLREQAVSVPSQMGKCINLSPDEAKLLYGMLYKLLG